MIYMYDSCNVQHIQIWYKFKLGVKIDHKLNAITPKREGDSTGYWLLAEGRDPEWFWVSPTN